MNDDLFDSNKPAKHMGADFEHIFRQLYEAREIIAIMIFEYESRKGHAYSTVMRATKNNGAKKINDRIINSMDNLKFIFHVCKKTEFFKDVYVSLPYSNGDLCRDEANKKRAEYGKDYDVYYTIIKY